MSVKLKNRITVLTGSVRNTSTQLDGSLDSMANQKAKHFTRKVPKTVVECKKTSS